MILSGEIANKEMLTLLREMRQSEYISGMAKELSETKGIGFWGPEENLPNPADYVDSSWNEEEKQKVISYLSDPKHKKVHYLGYSNCRLCNKLNGTADIKDGTFVWPEGFAHYLQDHGVRPPQEFVDYVMSKL